MFNRCIQLQISMNLKKCIFCTPFGFLLGHVIDKEFMSVDTTKITMIVDLLAPTIVKTLCVTLRHTGYYRIYLFEIIFDIIYLLETM